MFSLKGNEEYSDRVQIQWNHEAFDKIAGENGHILSKNICKLVVYIFRLLYNDSRGGITMSTRDAALAIFNDLNQDELEAFIVLFGKKHNNQSQKKSARDIWNSVADSQKIPLEEGAWERDVAERYGKDGEKT